MPRSIDLIVIHCTSSPNGQRVTDVDVDRWHRQRGFRREAAARARFNPGLASLGYHFLIGVNGALWTGRSLDEVGAHVRGHNAHTVAVCLVGTDAYTPVQWTMLAANVTALASMLRLPLEHSLKRGICGHRDLSDDLDKDGTIEPAEWIKTCPGFSVHEWLHGNDAHAQPMTPPPQHILQEP